MKRCLPAASPPFWRLRRGKTSLINAISGLTRPQKGRIVLNGRVLNDTEKRICLAPEKRRVGYVFQDARLFPHYKVRGNLKYGMAKSMAGQFDKLVALLGIEPLLDRLPGGLSGGEKQRVAIGRALLTAPELCCLMNRWRRWIFLVNVSFCRTCSGWRAKYIFRCSTSATRLMRFNIWRIRCWCWRRERQSLWLPGGGMEQQRDASVAAAGSAEHNTQRVGRRTASPLCHDRAGAGRAADLGELSRPASRRGDANSHPASDVSLVLEPPQQTSIRNVLPAQVVQCLETHGQIEVQLNVSGRTLWARISPWARDDLGSRRANGCLRRLKAYRLPPDYSRLRLMKSAILLLSFSPMTTLARALTSSTALPIATPVPAASSMLRSL